MTNLNRISKQGYSGAEILAAGGLINKDTPHSDIFYRALRRAHKKALLALCEKESIKNGLRLDKRVLP